MQMKNYVLTFLLLSVAVFTNAQDKKVEDPNAEKRTVKPFRSIKVSDGIEVYLTQSNEDAVAVSASRDEYKSRLKTEVENGELKIYYDRESFSDWTSTGKKLKAYISFKTLDKITAVAGSSVKVEGVIKEDVLSIYTKSGASFKGQVEAGKLVVESESGSKAVLNGSAGVFNASANSGARLEAYDLAAGKADVRSTSGAKIETTVNEEMKLYSSSGGSIHYKGKGKITEIQTNIGSIIRHGEN